MIVDRLNGLVEHLRVLGRPVVGLLRQGTTPADLDEARIQPQDVWDWFGWWNGVLEVAGKSQDEISVIPGYWPVSLAEALRMKPSYQEDSELGDTWIPLLVSGGGDIYAAVWKGEERPASQVCSSASRPTQSFRTSNPCWKFSRSASRAVLISLDPAAIWK
ncbi:hypothetical protein [Lentzea sp. E54]|uniref:hypothetical protein n=1 Tax=Lentzea xerophila TaxID=3435883 RepID=UPI003DA69556